MTNIKSPISMTNSSGGAIGEGCTVNFSYSVSEFVVRVEPEPLQRKMELLPTSLLLHIQHFLSLALLSRFLFYNFLYRGNFFAHYDINFILVML